MRMALKVLNGHSRNGRGVLARSGAGRKGEGHRRVKGHSPVARMSAATCGGPSLPRSPRILLRSSWLRTRTKRSECRALSQARRGRASLEGRRSVGDPATLLAVVVRGCAAHLTMTDWGARSPARLPQRSAMRARQSLPWAWKRSMTRSCAEFRLLRASRVLTPRSAPFPVERADSPWPRQAALHILHSYPTALHAKGIPAVHFAIGIPYGHSNTRQGRDHRLRPGRLHGRHLCGARHARAGADPGHPAGRPAHHHHRRRELSGLRRRHPGPLADGADAGAGRARRHQDGHSIM